MKPLLSFFILVLTSQAFAQTPGVTRRRAPVRAEIGGGLMVLSGSGTVGGTAEGEIGAEWEISYVGSQYHSTAARYELSPNEDTAFGMAIEPGVYFRFDGTPGQPDARYLVRIRALSLLHLGYTSYARFPVSERERARLLAAGIECGAETCRAPTSDTRADFIRITGVGEQDNRLGWSRVGLEVSVAHLETRGALRAGESSVDFCLNIDPLVMMFGDLTLRQTGGGTYHTIYEGAMRGHACIDIGMSTAGVLSLRAGGEIRYADVNSTGNVVRDTGSTTATASVRVAWERIGGSPFFVAGEFEHRAIWDVSTNQPRGEEILRATLGGSF